ncbi:MAG: chorismate lyase [Methylococcaceae bacterium]|nr:chorismate lyase [Methylococcaceae bacterium]
MPTHSTLFTQAPQWLKRRTGIRQNLPANVQSWVYETGSLTQRLRCHFGSRLRVKILLQHWHKPFINERQLLRLPQAQYTLIREVLLYADSTPLILARSIIPETTINVAHRNLSHLGTRPLGEVIFAYPNLQRLGLEITQLTLGAWREMCRNEFQIQQPVWGRRTVYAIPAQPLLVSEFFLPAVLDIGFVGQSKTDLMRDLG